MNIKRDIFVEIGNFLRIEFLENIIFDLYIEVRDYISSSSHSRFIQINLFNFQMSRINLC